jgi:uncharacterized protein YkwD
MATWVRWSVCPSMLVLGLAAAGAQVPAPWQDEWLARFNQERARAGVRLFLPSPVLSQVAQQEAEEMARSGRRLRAWPAEVVSERLRQVGYSAHDWREGFRVEPGVPGRVRFARSTSFPAILDGRFRDLGVGIAEVEGYTLYVFLFGWHEGDFFATATAGLADRARVAVDMLARVNDLRRREGLPPLARSLLLDRISQEHADDMLMRSYSGHRSPEGLGPSDRARADGYRPGIGENIVEQRFSVEEALDAWLKSPNHRRNLLDPHCRELGLGLAIGEGYDAAPGGYRVIWVQSFGRGS